MQELTFAHNDCYVKELSDKQKAVVQTVMNEIIMSEWSPNVHDPLCLEETIHGHIVTVLTTRRVPRPASPQRMDFMLATALKHMMDDCRWVEWTQGKMQFGIL